MGQKNYARYDFEIGVYRPPSEGGASSLLVRLTRNCPWNRCGFCAMYKDHKFEVRPVEQIKKDIDAMAAIRNDLEQISHQMGHGGQTNREAAIALITETPALNQHEGFVMLFNWLLSRGKTAFLQDANSLIMKTDQLVEVLRYLRRTFPSIDRVTSYARSKTLVQKSAQELEAIHQAGLDRLHVGLESGDEALLKKIKKGATPQVHIEGGQKAVAAGFQLSEYWMPGLGGKSMSQDHARHTAEVINAINPNYMRSRPFYPQPGTPLFEQVQTREFEPLSAREQLLELKSTMEQLEFTGKVCFDHAGNYWKDREGRLLFTHDYEGYQFPEQKPEVLARINEGLEADNKRPSFLRL